MEPGDQPTIGEMWRALARIDNRLNTIAAVTPEVFAAEIRTQQEIHAQHRHAIENLVAAIDEAKDDLEADVAELRGWLRWLFTLLVTNLITVLAMIVTAALTLL